MHNLCIHALYKRRWFEGSPICALQSRILFSGPTLHGTQQVRAEFCFYLRLWSGRILFVFDWFVSSNITTFLRKFAPRRAVFRRRVVLTYWHWLVTLTLESQVSKFLFRSSTICKMLIFVSIWQQYLLCVWSDGFLKIYLWCRIQGAHSTLGRNFPVTKKRCNFTYKSALQGSMVASNVRICFSLQTELVYFRQSVQVLQAPTFEHTRVWELAMLILILSAQKTSRSTTITNICCNSYLNCYYHYKTAHGAADVEIWR